MTGDTQPPPARARRVAEGLLPLYMSIRSKRPTGSGVRRRLNNGQFCSDLWTVRLVPLLACVIAVAHSFAAISRRVGFVPLLVCVIVVAHSFVVVSRRVGFVPLLVCVIAFAHSFVAISGRLGFVIILRTTS